ARQRALTQPCALQHGCARSGTVCFSLLVKLASPLRQGKTQASIFGPSGVTRPGCYCLGRQPRGVCRWIVVGAGRLTGRVTPVVRVSADTERFPAGGGAGG